MKRSIVAIKQGHSRTVLLVGRYALKFPSFLSWEGFVRGLLGNMTEKRWRNYNQILCPLLFTAPGGFLNVMPRAEIITGLSWLTSAAYSDLPVEHKDGSLGTLADGRVVFVDYGGSA